MRFSCIRHGRVEAAVPQYHYVYTFDYCKQFTLCGLTVAQLSVGVFAGLVVWLTMCCYIQLNAYASGYLEQKDNS